MAAHVGYLLVDEGKRKLDRKLRGRPTTRQLPRPVRRGLRLLAYLGPVALISLAAVGALIMLSRPVPDLAWPFLVFVAALADVPVCHRDGELVHLDSPQTPGIARMDFEHGIPDTSRTMAVVPTLLTERRRITETLEGWNSATWPTATRTCGSGC